MKISLSLGWLTTLSTHISKKSIADERRRHLRLNESEKVRDLGTGRSIEPSGEDVSKSGRDEDIGKGNSLSNKESPLSEDRVEDVESTSDTVYESLERSLVVRDLAAEHSVGKTTRDEDLLVGSGLVRVDNGLNLGVRGDEVLVGTDLGN